MTRYNGIAERVGYGVAGEGKQIPKFQHSIDGNIEMADTGQCGLHDIAALASKKNPVPTLLGSVDGCELCSYVGSGDLLRNSQVRGTDHRSSDRVLGNHQRGVACRVWLIVTGL